tara:strand:- start:9773 stop:11098 length:1326 start_codon:yes stop_codon:yes gene_type:complete
MTTPVIDLRWDPDRSSVPWTIESASQSGDTIGGMTASELRARTRAELGLDPDRPVILVGHQPVPWHPGILAKFMVGDLLARRHDAQLVHLVVDSHRGDWGRLEWPCGDDPESLGVRTWEFIAVDPDRPMRSQAASRPRPLPEGSGISGVLEGLHDWHAALEAECDAANAALQCAGALDRLMDPWIGSMRTITVSQLMGTTAGDILVRRISEDPSECIDAFNLAVDRHPTAGIRRLDDGPAGRPLPLWVEDGDGLRTATVADLPSGRLHPKALVLTAMARLGLADLFIHGLGGWRYDEAMESWLDGWLGLRPGRRAMATADLTLPLLGDPGFASARNELLQQARRRRHDPETSGGARGPGPSKAKVLAEISSLPRGSRERRVAWDRMHEWLDRQGGSEVDRDEALHRIEALASLSERRDWPFPLYGREALRELQLAIEAELG